MRRQDWALLCLASAGSQGLSPAQFQKSLFVLGQKFPSAVGEDFYEFKPYDYGPFSVTIYNDADELESDGLVSILNPGHTWARRYAATAEGIKLANEKRASAPADAVAYLDIVVRWAKGLSFQQLVTTIYKEFPAWREQSVFREVESSS